MKVKNLLYVLDCNVITICYAGFGQRIYKGPIDEERIPKYVLEYYVTLVMPSSIGNTSGIYIEVHESDSFISTRGE